MAVPTAPPTTQEALLSDFTYILDNATRCATFTCGGSLTIFTHPIEDASGNLTPRTEEKVNDQRILTKGITLRWGPDGGGRRLTVPDQMHSDRAAFEQLLADCTPATFGRDGADVYDETYRRAVAMSAEDFTTDFCPYEAGIIDIVTRLLLPPITGDLEPSPPRSELAAKHELNHVQEEEINTAIFSFMRPQGTKVDLRDIQKCLHVLNVDPANAQEMLEINGQLDPLGTMRTERDAFFDLVAKRVRERWLSMNPGAPNPKAERRRMMSRGIRAELYKLNVYSGPSGLFKPHVDTPRSDMQIGSLVVCLPVAFEGGALAVRHKLEEVVYDWSKPPHKENYPFLQWAAFYSDCEHEVMQVTAGHRITLTYNLFLANGASLSTCRPSSLERRRLPLVTNLKTMIRNNNFMPEGGYLGIHLAHRYPHTHPKLNKFVPNMLKGVDSMILDSISVLKLPALLCAVSKTGLPSHGILDTLDCMEEQRSKRQATCSIINDLSSFESKSDHEEEAPGDEREAEEKLVYSLPDPGDLDFEPDCEMPEYLDGWKTRFEDRSMIHWVNEAKHEEVSRAALAYGNQAELKVQYSCAAMVVKIPKLSLRKRRKGSEAIAVD